ncbi:sulfite exporter TauE/SafE family protein [Vibrio rhizosphaerae]|uniref:Probable membrane transporter protein n=1 Tax=Vibrio rhizosphaerae TaxID=398736 RepID=A0ABU4ITR5_9VIBR|nr:TSUP family transporter [Vibrio rhizosphaerae]MDW6092669.1 TSUP family transporter [Vibrio rhizosphaerae]
MDFLEPTLLIVLAVVAFVAGFIDGIAGGGGMLTVPALLSLGLPPHIALGTNKVAATFATSTAAFTYYRKKMFRPAGWKPVFISTFVGAIIGTLIVDFISTELLDKVLPIIILLTALYTIFYHPQHGKLHTHPDIPPQSKRKQIPQGLSLGFYDGIAGPGAGAFWVVSSMALYRLNILFASGLAKVMNLTSNITSLVTFAILGHINWVLGLTMGICLMAGAYVGAHSAIRFGTSFIRPVFILVVSILAIRLGYHAWFDTL